MHINKQNQPTMCSHTTTEDTVRHFLKNLNISNEILFVQLESHLNTQTHLNRVGN